MMTDNITLRPAQPDDADRAAVLLYSAYLHRQVDYPLHEEGENQFLERLQHYFREVRNRVGYQFIQVAEHRGEVVGLVLSFGGREEERLTPPLAGNWNARRRRTNGTSMPWPCSPAGAAKGLARACCRRRSSRHASTAIQRSR